MLSILSQPAAPRLALNIPASLIDVPDKRYEEMLYNENSPLSSPQSAADSDPINFSQPMSAPHNQLRYPSNQRNPSCSCSYPAQIPPSTIVGCLNPPSSAAHIHQLIVPSIRATTTRPPPHTLPHPSTTPSPLAPRMPSIPGPTATPRLPITARSRPTTTHCLIRRTTAPGPPPDPPAPSIPPPTYNPSPPTRRCHQTSRPRR